MNPRCTPQWRAHWIVDRYSCPVIGRFSDAKAGDKPLPETCHVGQYCSYILIYQMAIFTNLSSIEPISHIFESLNCELSNSEKLNYSQAFLNKIRCEGWILTYIFKKGKVST